MTIIIKDIGYNPASERVFDWPDPADRSAADRKKNEAAARQERLALEEWYKSLKKKDQDLIIEDEDEPSKNEDKWSVWLDQLAGLSLSTVGLRNEIDDLERDCEREAKSHIKENLLAATDYMTEQEGVLLLSVADWYATHAGSSPTKNLQKALDIYRVVMEDEALPCRWHTFYNRSCVESRLGLWIDAGTHLEMARRRAPQPFGPELCRRFAIQQGRIEMARRNFTEAELIFSTLLREEFNYAVWELAMDCRVKKLQYWNLPLSEVELNLLAETIGDMRRAERLFTGRFRLKNCELVFGPALELERLEKLYQDGKLEDFMNEENDQDVMAKIQDNRFLKPIANQENSDRTENNPTIEPILIKKPEVEKSVDELRSKFSSAPEKDQQEKNPRAKQSLCMTVKGGVRKVIASPTIKVTETTKSSTIEKSMTERRPIVWDSNTTTEDKMINDDEENSSKTCVKFKKEGLEDFSKKYYATHPPPPLPRTLPPRPAQHPHQQSPTLPPISGGSNKYQYYSIDKNFLLRIVFGTSSIRKPKKKIRPAAKLVSRTANRCPKCFQTVPHAASAATTGSASGSIRKSLLPRPVALSSLATAENSGGLNLLKPKVIDFPPPALFHSSGFFKDFSPYAATQWSYRDLAAYQGAV